MMVVVVVWSSPIDHTNRDSADDLDDLNGLTVLDYEDDNAAIERAIRSFENRAKNSKAAESTVTSFPSDDEYDDLGGVIVDDVPDPVDSHKGFESDITDGNEEEEYLRKQRNSFYEEIDTRDNVLSFTAEVGEGDGDGDAEYEDSISNFEDDIEY